MMQRRDGLIEFLWGLIAIVLFILMVAVALSSSGYGQNIEGQPVASQYSTWRVSGYAPDTYTFAPTACRVQGGSSFFTAFTVGTPVRIVDGNPSLSETVTPSSVTSNNTTCSIAIAPANHHNLPFYLSSATGGLQEAINANYANPASNTIILDNAFYQAVGQSNVGAVIGAARGYSTLGLVDITQTPYVWYTWNGTHYVVASVGQDVVSVFGRTGAITADTGDYDCAQVTGCLTSAPVTSVFGRTGAIAAQTGDYACDQVTGCGSSPNAIFSSTLASSINGTATTIPLTTSAASLAASGVVVVDNEWIQYTGISGDNLTGAVRGYHQTFAASHSSGASVYSVVLDFGSSSQVPFNYILSNGGPETVSAVLGCQYPDPAAEIFAQFGCATSDFYFDGAGGIHQPSNSTENVLQSPTGIGPGGGTAFITNSGYLFDSTRQNNSTVPQGFGAGLASRVAVIQPPTIAAPSISNFAGTGSTTWSWRCTGTDVDGNTFPGTDVTITNGPSSVPGGGYFIVQCPFSAGAVTESIWRTAGPGTTGFLYSAAMPAQTYDGNASASGTPPTTNATVPKACVGGSEVSCWITSASAPTGACTNGWIDTNQSGSPATLYQCISSSWVAIGPSPTIEGHSIVTGQSSSVGLTTIYTPSAAGIYEVVGGAVCTGAGSTGATMTVTASWNNGGSTLTQVLGTSAAAFTAVGDDTAQGNASQIQVLVGAGTNIQIEYQIGGSPATNPTYSYWYTVVKK